MITKLDTEVGEIVIVNVHLYAGSTPVDEDMRFRQVKYFESLLDELELNNLPIIINGYIYIPLNRSAVRVNILPLPRIERIGN